MILDDLYTKLAADTTLATLLGASGSDSKIYPFPIKADVTFPAVGYFCLNPGGTRDEILQEEEVQLSAFASTYAVASSIAERLSIILDVQDQIEITSSDYYIYWCKKIGGNDKYEEDTQLYHRALIFSLRFKKKSA